MKKQSCPPRLITVEPLLFLATAIQGVLISLRTQYIESRLAASYNYTLPNIASGNSTCGLNETNSTGNEIETKIQAETAIWILYLKDTSTFLPMFTAIVLAAASDYIGRRPIFIFGSLCHLLAACIFLLVSVFDLPLAILICAEAILGLGGDIVAIESVACAYIIDVYSREKQAFRLVVVSVMGYIGFGVIQTVIGSILQYTHDFNLSFSCAVIIGIVNLLYVCFPYFIPETVKREGIPKGLLKEMFLNYGRLFQKSRGRNRLRLLGNLAGDFVYTLIHEAVFAIITIYGIAAPFCWTPFETGIYATMVYMFPAICAVLGARILNLFCNRFWMLHISFTSAIAELLVTAWAQTSRVLLYAGYVLCVNGPEVGITVGLIIVIIIKAPVAGFLRTLAHPLYKAQMSATVLSDEQGVLFGCQGLVASVAKVCSPLVLNTAYAALVQIGKPEVTFFIATGLMAIPIVINGLLQFTEYRSPKDQLLINEELDDETIN